MFFTRPGERRPRIRRATVEESPSLSKAPLTGLCVVTRWERARLVGGKLEDKDRVIYRCISVARQTMCLSNYCLHLDQMSELRCLLAEA